MTTKESSSKLVGMASYKSPLGTVNVGADEAGVVFCCFGNAYLPILGAQNLTLTRKPSAKIARHLSQTITELTRYFSGKPANFRKLALNLTGTPFQLATLKALRDVPVGEVISYGELAQKVRSPRAARAIGSVCSKNSICIIVPCHRVISSSGLGGYSAGLSRKTWLLKHELNLTS